MVAIDYLKEGEEMPSERLVEPYTFERVLPHWLIHTWDRTADGERSFRLDRMRSARLTDESFEPRKGFDPHFLVDTRPVRVRYAKPIARYRIERGATPLTDGVGDRNALDRGPRLADGRDPGRPRRGRRRRARGPAAGDRQARRASSCASCD